MEECVGVVETGIRRDKPILATEAVEMPWEAMVSVVVLVNAVRVDSGSPEEPPEVTASRKRGMYGCGEDGALGERRGEGAERRFEVELVRAMVELEWCVAVVREE